MGETNRKKKYGTARDIWLFADSLHRRLIKFTNKLGKQD